MVARFVERAKRAAPLGIFLLSALLATHVVFDRPGWPENHEGLSWKFRTLVHAAHLRRLDPFPLWSSEDLFGHGTPMPMYYHKAFYLVAGALYNALGRVKESVWLAICFWMVLGSVGTYRAVRILGGRRVTAIVLGALLPWLHYSAFDWLVRGALAEFSAAMCVPWLLVACLREIQRVKPGFLLAPVMWVLALAHSVIAGYSIIPIGVCLVVRMIRGGEPWWRVTARFLAMGATTLVLFFPWLLGAALLSPTFDPSRITDDDYHPSRQFISFEKYFLDYRFLPGSKEMWLSPQLNQALLSSGLAALLLAVLPRTAPVTGPPGARRRTWSAWLCADGIGAPAQGGLVFLVPTLAVMFLLQLPVCGIVYECVPGMSYLQFPWRLLAFINPLLLLVLGCMIGLVERRWDPRLGTVLVATTAFGVLLESVSLRPVRWTWYDQAVLEAPMPIGSSAGAPGALGEFWPRSAHPDARETTDCLASMPQILERYRTWAERGPEFVDPAIGTARMVPRQTWEQMEFRVVAHSHRPGTLVLPLTHSGLECVERLDGKTWRLLASHAVANDSRIRVDLPAGRHRLRIRMPTLWDLPKRLWAGLIRPSSPSPSVDCEQQ